MSVEQIQTQKVTCDRCKVFVNQGYGESALAPGWSHATLCLAEESTRTPSEADLCPKCTAIIQDALKPLERTRRGSAEKE